MCFLGLSLITDRRSNVTMGMPDEWMMMLMTEKERCHEMMGRSVEASIKCLTLLEQAVGHRCFAWGIASDDSGTQPASSSTQPLGGNDRPHYRKLCDWVHAHTPWKAFLHSCGSIYRLIPHFIEAGVDILNPVQTSAASMEPERLKKEFGGKIVFWGGGCDTQRVLGGATPEEVREHVRERMEISLPGADTSSTRSTTSRSTCRRKTWSPCSTRPTVSAAIVRQSTDEGTLIVANPPIMGVISRGRVGACTHADYAPGNRVRASTHPALPG